MEKMNLNPKQQKRLLVSKPEPLNWTAWHPSHLSAQISSIWTKALVLTEMLSGRSFDPGFEGETNQELAKQIDVGLRARTRQSLVPLTSGPVGDRLRPK